MYATIIIEPSLLTTYHLSSEKRILLFEVQSLLPEPPLKMASNLSPEIKSILIRTHDLMTALSNEPLGVAGILLSKGFISGEIMSKMLVVSYTQIEKATILIEAVRNKIELAPSRFPELLEILSEVTCAKEVVESLQSTYQSELTSLVHVDTRKVLGVPSLYQLLPWAL